MLLAALGLSISYSSVPWQQALGDWGKYGKLVVLPLVLLLLTSLQQCKRAIATLLIAQTVVLISSCLLSAGVTLPWVPVARNAVATVFSSYLDQAIMTAGFAGICWHFRAHFPSKFSTWLAGGLALLAVVNVMAMLPGRSGQMAMLAVVTLAVWWAMPARWRLLMVVVPVLLTTVAAVTPSKFQERMGMAVTELRAYSEHDDKTTSTGIRLNFWHHSLQAIAERPLTGFGVGSWGQQFLRLAGPSASLGVSPRSNPHQEYLQLGVQIGLGGIVLLIALMATLARDAQRFQTPVKRATQSLVAVFAVVCLFNSSLFDALIGDYFCGALGILLAYGASELAPVKASP